TTAEERAQAADERARQLHELQMFLQGYRATAPTPPAPEAPETMRGARTGLARTADDRDEDPLLRGVRFTPSGVTFDPNRRLLTQGRTTPLLARFGEGAATSLPQTAASAPTAVPLAAALGEMMPPGPDEPPRLRARPGAFGPDPGRFYSTTPISPALMPYTATCA